MDVNDRNVITLLVITLLFDQSLCIQVNASKNDNDTNIRHYQLKGS